jgi:T5orf172 domain
MPQKSSSSKKDHGYQAVRSFETIKTTETTYNACPDGGDHSIGAEGEVITVTNTTETMSTAETAIESTGNKQYVEKTSTVTTMQRVKTVSKFCSPPVENINFMAGPWDSARKSLRTEERLINAHAKELQTLCQRFMPFMRLRDIHLSVQEYIHQCLVKPLTKREWSRPLQRPGLPLKHPKQALNYSGQGLIYMYWVPGNFGYVKIGKTSGESTKARLEQWTKQRGHPTEEHTNGEEEVAVQLPHVFRVEALVHAELRDFGIKEVSCKKCEQKYKEWFRVSPGHAQKVITKWSNWMESRKPYTEIDGVWRLRKEISAQEINALCTPIGVPSRQNVALPTTHRDRQTKTPAKRVKGRQKSK